MNKMGWKNISIKMGLKNILKTVQHNSSHDLFSSFHRLILKLAINSTSENESNA